MLQHPTPSPSPSRGGELVTTTIMGLQTLSMARPLAEGVKLEMAAILYSLILEKSINKIIRQFDKSG